jgi:hypothetical protein
VSCTSDGAEVNASYEAMSWRVQIFDAAADAVSAQLKASDTLMLVHKAVDGILMLDAIRAAAEHNTGQPTSTPSQFAYPVAAAAAAAGAAGAKPAAESAEKDADVEDGDGNDDESLGSSGDESDLPARERGALTV